MINRHRIAYSEDTKNFYILKGGLFFDGFNADHSPKYNKNWGRLYETEEWARAQAQTLNDIECALNQVQA